MKKLLLTAFTGILASAAMAQICTPDPAYTPSSPTGAGIKDLPCAIINVPYSQPTTVVIPPQVAYEVTPGNPVQVFICKVTVDSISNFPAYTQLNTPIVYKGVTYGFGTQITIDPLVDRACVLVSATFTELYDDSLGVYGKAAIALSQSGCSSPLANVPFTELTDDGGPLPIGFKVQNAGQCNTSVEESMSNNSFDVAQNFPNPFNGESQIAFSVPQSGKVTFRVTNLVGKTIKETNMNANGGTNYINISSSEFAAGVYMYSITFDGKTVTKRMIIK